jgi:two-component system OmpR family response regulator
MADAKHILVVDDDPEIRRLLVTYLERNGYRASAVADGAGMDRLVARGGIDLVVLDVMLPDRDGLTLCRDLRAHSDLPVIMLTARGEDTDRIVGLEMGADDYLPKPFNPRELLARIHAVLRRVAERPLPQQGAGLTVRQFAGWTLDPAARELIDPQGVVVALSAGEYRLLELFVAHPHRVLTRDELLDRLRGRDWDPDDRSVDIQVSRLRRRLRDDAREPRLIKTVRGEGYVLATRVESVPRRPGVRS